MHIFKTTPPHSHGIFINKALGLLSQNSWSAAREITYGRFPIVDTKLSNKKYENILHNNSILDFIPYFCYKLTKYSVLKKANL